MMESTHLQTLSLLLFLSLLTTTSAVPRISIVGAVKSLSKSGFYSMALTLTFANRTLLPPNTRTIFAPPDSAFQKSGQPPLSLLHFHFSPVPVSFRTLTVASNIPSFLPNHSLVVTSLPEHGLFTLNGVNVSAFTLFHDAFLQVFGTQGFFDPDFVYGSSKDDGFSCDGGRKLKHTVGDQASGVLKIGGFSIMAAFLDLQVGEFGNNTPMTVFAPPDVELKGSVRSFTRFRTVFLRHLVPCKISGSDLESIDEGMVIPTFLQGYGLEVNKSGSELRIGGVYITEVDMFSNDWMVIHGIEKSLVEEDPPRGPRDFAQSSSERITVIKFLLYGVVVLAFVIYSNLFTLFCHALVLFWYFFTLCR